MADPTLPEPWLRGPVADVAAVLQPAAHALLQAREDLARAASPLRPDELWVAPGGAASVGFHLRHLAGSTDRLLTYAAGRSLDDAQRATLAAEQAPARDTSVGDLVRGATDAIDRALGALRAADPATLYDARVVGRAALPTTVSGLLCHVADHAQRHAAQVITTAKIVRGLGLREPGAG